MELNRRIGDIKPRTGRATYGELVNLNKKQIIATPGYFKVYAGVVVLVAKSGNKTGALSVLFPGDNVCISHDCWVESLSKSSLFIIDPIIGLEVKQFADAAVQQLENRDWNSKENSFKRSIYQLLQKFTQHGITGVNITEIAKVVGASRETTGRRIDELIKEHKISKVAPSYCRTL